jgi:hypothetical protein
VSGTKQQRTLPPDSLVVGVAGSMFQPSDTIGNESNVFVVGNEQDNDVYSPASSDDFSLDRNDFLKIFDDTSFETASWDDMMAIHDDQIAVDDYNVLSIVVNSLAIKSNVPNYTPFKNSIT